MIPVNKRLGKGAALGGAVAIAAAAFITPWEGVFLHPYRDIVGVPTWCIGETEGKPKASYTVAECKALLASKLPRYYSEISACWGDKVEAVISDNERVAYLSGAYNFGSGAFCKSSMVRLLKAGDRVGACHALRLYNRAGGRVVKGLDNRRRAEEKLCLEGL